MKYSIYPGKDGHYSGSGGGLGLSHVYGLAVEPRGGASSGPFTRVQPGKAVAITVNVDWGAEHIRLCWKPCKKTRLKPPFL